MAGTFWRTVLFFDESKIASDIALRNAIGITLPLIIAAAAGNIPAGVVASLGALNVCYSDSRDPYAERARRMVRASVLVGLAVTVGALSAYNSVTAVIAATLWAFAIGMMVVIGNKAADLGAVSLVTLLVFAGRSLTVTEALWSGLLALGGGLLQTLLSIALWPVKPYEPERAVIASLYRALAEIAVLQAGSHAPPPATGSLLSAQEALSSLSQNRSVESERLVFLLTQAERLRLTILTLRRLARRIHRDPRGATAAASLTSLLTAVSAALDAIAASVEKGTRETALAWVTNKIADFRATQWPDHSPLFSALIRDADYHLEALAGQLRAASEQPEPRAVSKARQTAAAFSSLSRMKANLTLNSTAFRHAVRLAVCVGAGDAISRGINLQRGYWLPMTVAIVLKPDFTATFARGTQRIAGTLAGLAIATACFRLLHTGVSTDIALVAVFAFFGRWIGPANYALFVSALSAIVVLLIALGGVEPGSAIVARALNTTLGGVLALSAWRLWPTWERALVAPAVAAMLRAYRVYLHTVMDVYQGGSLEPVDSQRMPGRLARSNAEASVGRLSTEPGVTPDQINLWNAILVTSHGLVRAIMALESAILEKRGSVPHPAVLSFAADAETVLLALADRLSDIRPLPSNLPDIRPAWKKIDESAPSTLITTETDHIATSLNTLREQITGELRIR